MLNAVDAVLPYLRAEFPFGAAHAPSPLAPLAHCLLDTVGRVLQATAASATGWRRRGG